MADKLREFELEEINEFEQDEKRFKIEDVDALNWAMRKVKALKEEKEEALLSAKKEIERINEWIEKENNKYDNQINFFEGLMMEYAMMERKKDPFFKKKATPFGAVSFRKRPPKWNYDDEVLVNFLKENEYTDFVNIKYSPNKADLKKEVSVVNGKAVFDTGEIVEGVEIVDQDEDIVIKVEK